MLSDLLVHTTSYHQKTCQPRLPATKLTNAMQALKGENEWEGQQNSCAASSGHSPWDLFTPQAKTEAKKLGKCPSCDLNTLHLKAMTKSINRKM